MAEPARERAVLGVIFLVALAAFLPGINWGLPSRHVDPYLFGDEKPWSGEKIAKLAPTDAGVLGADIDANPILNRSQTVWLNETDHQRAEIIRRFRLFSYQPDEMITFKSLSRIREHGGDPRLYQYGGLWIYPVGALLKVFLNPRSDQQYYLDHPEAFGHFYIVARLYAAAWGLAAAWAVFWIIRRISGGLFLAAAGAVCFVFMPATVTLAHEAKPHLPGLALTLLAVLAAAKYVETGRAKWSVATGVFCGAAFGMVLSALVAFAIIPVMAFLRRQSLGERLSAVAHACGVGIVAYIATNPFIVINLMSRPEVLRSQLGNSTAMYAVTLGGIRTATGLLAEAASPVLMIGGLVGLATLAVAAMRRRGGKLDEQNAGQCDAGLLLAGPAVVAAIQFVLLAADKSPEYGRFALLPATFLLVAAFAAIGRVRWPRPRRVLAMAVVAFTFVFGYPYVVAFVRDSTARPSRLVAAERMRSMIHAGATTLRIPAEPAYVMPPVDLFRTRLLIAPPGKAVQADLIVDVDSYHTLAPISWADVRFAIISPRERLRRLNHLVKEPATRPGGATTVSSPP